MKEKIINILTESLKKNIDKINKNIIIDNVETIFNFNLKQNKEEFIIEITVNNKYIKDKFVIISNIKDNIILDNNIKHYFKLPFIEKKYQEIIEFTKCKYIITYNKEINKKFLPYDINYVNIANKDKNKEFFNKYVHSIIDNIIKYYKKINSYENKIYKIIDYFKLKNLKFVPFTSFLYNDYIGLSLYDKNVIYFQFNKNLYYLIFYKGCILYNKTKNIIEEKNCNLFLIKKINSFLKR